MGTKENVEAELQQIALAWDATLISLRKWCEGDSEHEYEATDYFDSRLWELAERRELLTALLVLLELHGKMSRGLEFTACDEVLQPIIVRRKGIAKFSLEEAEWPHPDDVKVVVHAHPYRRDWALALEKEAENAQETAK